MMSGSAIYNLPAALHLTGRLDLGAMRQTLSEVVRRHEALRTTFAVADGQPVQVTHPPRPLDLPLIDISSLPTERRRVESRRLAQEEAHRSEERRGGKECRSRWSPY